MSDSYTINAEIREDVGKGASRRLRRDGKLPAVLYGGHKEPVALTLIHKDIMHDAVNESFYSSIMEITVADGRSQQVVVRDLQRHPFKQQILHVDFLRVSATETLRMSIPLHFVGEDESPAGRASGVVIQHQMTDIEVSALPKDLPEYIEVDLSRLKPGGAVMLSDVKVPEGVEIMLLSQDDDSDVMVANAVHISESQGTGAAAAAEAEATVEDELGISDLPGVEQEGESDQQAPEGGSEEDSRD